MGFADFWLADQLNSLVSALLDFEFLTCFYVRNGDWLNAGGTVTFTSECLKCLVSTVLFKNSSIFVSVELRSSAGSYLLSVFFCSNGTCKLYFNTLLLVFVTASDIIVDVNFSVTIVTFNLHYCHYDNYFLILSRCLQFLAYFLYLIRSIF